MNEHTPGPWIIGVQMTYYNWPSYTIRDMRDSTDNGEIQANARLIAAAPALYEALKRQRQGLFNLIDMSIVPTSYNDAVHEEIARIDAALALVDGES